MKKLVSCIAVLMLLLMTATVQAQPTLDFSLLGPSGTITLGSTLSGSGIPVPTVTGDSTPLNAGVSQTVNGTLSFTTGSLLFTTSNTWVFGGGGSFSISPGLLSGSFSGNVVVTNFGGVFDLVGSLLLTSAPSAALESFYGLTGLPFGGGTFNLGFNAIGSPPTTGFTSTSIGSGDLTTSPVPAPGFLVLLCSGGAVSLLGCAWRRARKEAA